WICHSTTAALPSLPSVCTPPGAPLIQMTRSQGGVGCRLSAFLCWLCGRSQRIFIARISPCPLIGASGVPPPALFSSGERTANRWSIRDPADLLVARIPVRIHLSASGRVTFCVTLRAARRHLEASEGYAARTTPPARNRQVNSVYAPFNPSRN